jgi:uncharacterized protein YjgD (DUF1641 family)
MVGGGTMSGSRSKDIDVEELAREIRELKDMINDLVAKLEPLLFLVDKLPDLMNDPAVFKSIAPMLALPYALERSNVNILGAAMVGGVECLRRSLENAASNDRPPELSLIKLLTDKELRRSLGLLMEILKALMPCLHRSLREMKE